MTELALSEYLERGTQGQVAAALGVGQSAVSQMARSGRDIRVVVDPDYNVIRAFEVKPIGRSASEKAA